MNIKLIASILFFTSQVSCSQSDNNLSSTDDYSMGLRWFERAIHYNDPQYFQNAIKYWQPLLAENDCDAEYYMGLMYFAGFGVKQNFKEAYRLWIKAGSANQAKAQSALGDLYFQNEQYVFHHCTKTPSCQLTPDLEAAFFWYKLAEQSASNPREQKYLKNVLAKVKAKLTQFEIDFVEQQIATWMPTPKDCEARDTSS